MIREYTRGRVFIARLAHGDDLLESLTALCHEKNIRVGVIRAIGALSRARIACYDQQNHRYEEIDLTGPWEILSLTGNISLRDGKPVCHLHVTLGDEEGKAAGGHLVAGCTIYAGEAVIEEFLGPELVRGFDEETKLPLWE